MSDEVIVEIKKRITQIKAERKRVTSLRDDHVKRIVPLNNAIDKLTNDIELANDAIEKLQANGKND